MMKFLQYTFCLLILILFVSNCKSIPLSEEDLEATDTLNVGQLSVNDNYSQLPMENNESPIIYWEQIGPGNKRFRTSIFENGHIQLDLNNEPQKLLTSNPEDIFDLFELFEQLTIQDKLWSSKHESLETCQDQECIKYNFKLMNRDNEINEVNLVVNTLSDLPSPMNTIAYEIDHFIYYKTEEKATQTSP